MVSKMSRKSAFWAGATMQQAYFRTIPWILVFWKSAFLAGATMQQADFRTIPWILDLEKSAFFLVQQCNRHFHILILDEDKKALFKLVSATAQQAVFYTYCQKMSPKSAFCLGATVQQADFRTIPWILDLKKALYFGCNNATGIFTHSFWMKIKKRFLS